jgi:hypothetical protein
MASMGFFNVDNGFLEAVRARRGVLLFIQLAILQGAAATCDPFHGCVDMGDRVRTLRKARMCIAVGADAPGCGEEGIRNTSKDDRADTVYCGFASAEAYGWLERVRMQTRECDLVVFTVVTNKYDRLPPVQPEGPSHQENTLMGLGPPCHIAFLDEPTFAVEMARPAHNWTLVRLPVPLPFAASPARLSHTLKMSATRMFSNARYVLYHDAKIKLNVPPRTVISMLANQTNIPLLVRAHGSRGARADGPWLEFSATVGRLNTAIRGKSAHAHDLAQLHVQQALYASEGAFNNQYGMIDSSVLVHQRAGPPLALNGSAATRAWMQAAQLVSDDATFEAAAAAVTRSVEDGWAAATPSAAELNLGVRERLNVLRWIECAWFTEVALLSQREQLSFVRVVDELGTRRYIFAFGSRQPWFQRNSGRHGPVRRG